ncbi:MAG: SDR family oxidoreductase [Candidatus Levybacteria bacterium]|nr:SDR family oxidoreductase [Candidatus Levybacteria bacterium]
MSKRILIAGGSGFIGSHLSTALLAQGNYILCLDNLKTGQRRNIKTLVSDKFQFIRGDICSKHLMIKLKQQPIDEIYHLASPASVTYVTEHPIETALVNSQGTYHLLELAREKNARILFTSSSEAYGDPQEHPQKESYWGNVNPVGVRSGYDEGKRFSEALSMAYYREFGLRVSIVRIFNTYGPNASLDDTRVIPRFINQALRNEPLTVHGDGRQTRSFCYVSDMVSGLIKAMDQTDPGPLNLGNPDEYKILDVAKKIISLTNSKSKIVFTTRLANDPYVRRPDISQARKKLGWTPTVSFERGLMNTIQYFRGLL